TRIPRLCAPLTSRYRSRPVALARDDKSYESDTARLKSCPDGDSGIFSHRLRGLGWLQTANPFRLRLPCPMHRSFRRGLAPIFSASDFSRWAAIRSSI